MKIPNVKIFLLNVIFSKGKILEVDIKKVTLIVHVAISF